MSKESSDALSQENGLSPNDKVNPVADNSATTPESVDRNSGSTHCSFSAIEFGSTRRGQTRHRVGVHKLLSGYNLTVDQINHISDEIYNRNLDGNYEEITVRIPPTINLTNSIKQVVEEAVQRALLSVEKFVTKQPML